MGATEGLRPEHCRPPAGLRWACMDNVPISRLIPFSTVLLVVMIISFALVKQYVLEMLVMRRVRLYRETCARLSPRDQRTLVNHHLSLSTKLFILFFALYPFARIAHGANFSTPLYHGSPLTVGDMMFVTSHLYTAMYTVELCYRQGISPIAWVHHICTALMAQTAIQLSRQARKYPDSAIEMFLCLIWGAFDVVSEAIPHATLIIYRLYPKEHARLLFWFRAAFVATIVSTGLETVIILWIYGALFHRWHEGLKVMTPMLHFLFTVAQLWSAWCLWKLGNRQKNLMSTGRDDEADMAEHEGLPQSEDGGKWKVPPKTASSTDAVRSELLIEGGSCR